MEIKSLRGMNDIFPPEIQTWVHAESVIRKQLESFGYNEVRTPILESTALFSRSVGETTDIVNKEMYTFTDRGGDSVTMRPEGTAAVVRAVLEKGLLGQEPIQKLFYFGPMFRYERPQKGRYRQFHQYGIEVFGISEPQFDAELIAMLVDLYSKLGLKNLITEVSSLGCKACRPTYREALVKFLTPLAPQLCKECQDRIQKNPMRVLDCKNPTCQSLTKDAPSMLDCLCGDCSTHFDGVKNNLQTLKTPFHVNRRLVRGLDYYNRTVFEITTQDLGAQNAVGGGGRYDDLIPQLGGPASSAVGYAGGFERLVLLMQNQKPIEPEKPKAFFVAPDDEGRKFLFPLAFSLRQKGIFIELDHQGKSMKAQMKRADKFQVPYVLIVGGGEIQKGIAVLRDMQSKSQSEISLSQLEEELLRRLK